MPRLGRGRYLCGGQGARSFGTCLPVCLWTHHVPAPRRHWLEKLWRPWAQCRRRWGWGCSWGGPRRDPRSRSGGAGRRRISRPIFPNSNPWMFRGIGSWNFHFVRFSVGWRGHSHLSSPNFLHTQSATPLRVFTGLWVSGLPGSIDFGGARRGMPVPVYRRKSLGVQAPSMWEI